MAWEKGYEIDVNRTCYYGDPNFQNGPGGFYVYHAREFPRVHVTNQGTNTEHGKSRKPINEPHQESSTPATIITPSSYVYAQHLGTSTKTHAAPDSAYDTDHNRTTGSTPPSEAWTHSSKDSNPTTRKGPNAAYAGRKESAWNVDKGPRSSKQWKDASNLEVAL
jgi:hypothetical protein